MTTHKYILFSFCLLIVFIFTACSRQPIVQTKTQLQVREFQSRTYDTRDIKLVLKAMINVLQDEGFIIKTANVELGLLSAVKEVELNREVLSIGGISIRDTGNIKSIITECSASISEFGNNVRVRINFQEKKYDNKGVSEVKLIDNEKYYQSIYAKIEKSIFIEKEKL